MIDLTEDQMLGMARIAGLHIPDEDVVLLTRASTPCWRRRKRSTNSRWRTSWLSTTLTSEPVQQRDSRGRRCWRRKRTPLGLQAHHRIGAFDTDATPVAGGTDRPVSGTHRSVQRRVEVVYHGLARERGERPKRQSAPKQGSDLGPCTASLWPTRTSFTRKVCEPPAAL